MESKLRFRAFIAVMGMAISGSVGIGLIAALYYNIPHFGPRPVLNVGIFQYSASPFYQPSPASIMEVLAPLFLATVFLCVYPSKSKTCAFCSESYGRANKDRIFIELMRKRTPTSRIMRTTKLRFCCPEHYVAYTNKLGIDIGLVNK